MSLEWWVNGTVIIAEEGKKYRVSAGTPIPAVFWLSREELIALGECINRILECGV